MLPIEIVFIGRILERLIVATYGPMLLYIGYRLFVMGVSGDMKLIAKMGPKSATLTSVAPGTLCFILAVIQGSVVMCDVLSVSSTSPVPRVSAASVVASPAVAAAGAQATLMVPAPASSASVAAVVAEANPEATFGGYSITFYGGGGGAGTPPPLSLLLRYGLADLYLCTNAAALAQDTATAQTACDKKFGKEFQRIPAESDLKAIEVVEAKVYKVHPDPNAEASLTRFRSQYLVTMPSPSGHPTP